MRHPPVPVDYPPPIRPPPEEYYSRRQVLYEPEYVPAPPRERTRTYRELPPHRMPDYYNTKYEDEAPKVIRIFCQFKHDFIYLFILFVVKATET